MGRRMEDDGGQILGLGMGEGVNEGWGEYYEGVHGTEYGYGRFEMRRF